MEATKIFTKNELSENNGKNGKPAYVAFKGKVYDVTDSSLWMEGEHLGHFAGEDLTMAMDIAPHGDEIMQKVKVVGNLAES